LFPFSPQQCHQKGDIHNEEALIIVLNFIVLVVVIKGEEGGNKAVVVGMLETHFISHTLIKL
jgi:hypothetical protein